MKRIFVVIAVVLQVFIVRAQVIKVNKTYIFTHKIIYSGFDKNSPGFSQVAIYWDYENPDHFALETLDREGRSLGVMIFDNSEHYQYLLDRREHTGVRMDLSAVIPHLTKMRLRKDTASVVIKGFKTEHYTAKDKSGNVYDYWFADKSPAMDSTFALINSLGMNFIKYPEGKRTVIVNYKVTGPDGSQIAHFLMKSFDPDGYYKFDLSQYTIQERK